MGYSQGHVGIPERKNMTDWEKQHLKNNLNKVVDVIGTKCRVPLEDREYLKHFLNQLFEELKG